MAPGSSSRCRTPEPERFVGAGIEQIVINRLTIAISNNRWDEKFSDGYHPRFTTARPYVWSQQHAQMITDDLWLPLGKPVNATTTQESKT